MKTAFCFFSVLFVLTIFSQMSFAQVNLSASPTMLNFQTEVGSTSSPQNSIVFFNIYGDFSISLWTSHNCQQNFSISSSCIGSHWMSGSCNINANYRPKTSGSHSCSVQVQSSPGGFVTVMLSGRTRGY